MTIAFFVARIAVLPPYYYAVYKVLTTDHVYTLNPVFLFIWVGGSIGLDILNILWFKKMLRGCIKVLRARKDSQKVTETNGDGDAMRNRVKGE